MLPIKWKDGKDGEISLALIKRILITKSKWFQIYQRLISTYLSILYFFCLVVSFISITLTPPAIASYPPNLTKERLLELTKRYSSTSYHILSTVESLQGQPAAILIMDLKQEIPPLKGGRGVVLPAID